MDINPPRLAIAFFIPRKPRMVCAPHHACFPFPPTEKNRSDSPQLSPCGLLFPSKKSPAIPKSYESFESFQAFVYFNLGLALLAYSPFLAGIGTLLLERKKEAAHWGKLLRTSSHHH
jgi:hypothetical protein